MSEEQRALIGDLDAQIARQMAEAKAMLPTREFPAAVALVTVGPAEAIGLPNNGRLAPGCAADLVLVEQDGRWPRVVCVRASPCGQAAGQAVPRQLTELAIAQHAVTASHRE
jgi:cytosine/adenosine deaminase-related metal-dependent hydrolase